MVSDWTDGFMLSDDAGQLGGSNRLEHHIGDFGLRISDRQEIGKFTPGTVERDGRGAWCVRLGLIDERTQFLGEFAPTLAGLACCDLHCNGIELCRVPLRVGGKQSLDLVRGGHRATLLCDICTTLDCGTASFTAVAGAFGPTLT